MMDHLETISYSNKQEFLPKDKNGLYLTNTNDLKQSRFLPLLQQAENNIKKLITKYLMENKSEFDLRYTISLYINDFSIKKLPFDIPNRQSYIRGLFDMSNKVYKQLLKQKLEFAAVLGILTTALIKSGYKLPKINSPKELATYITENKDKIKYDMWTQAKASVRVSNYPKQLEDYIKKASEIPTLAIEDGKKPISIWQKAELDIRHENQMKKLDNLREQGIEYAWISSHPDCSKRCEKWQGKLMNIDKNTHAELSGFRMKDKVDGHTVYCLQDIMDQKDKYGYNNNIIVGFNCRHYLIPYEPGKLPPKEYDEKDVKRMREINEKIRLMEREIRLMETQKKMLISAGKPKQAKMLEVKIKKATMFYREFCNKNGFASQMYRL